MFQMRAVIFEIEKFATHDGPGIRTVVFLKGCPLRCMWCHSPESWDPSIQRYPDGTEIGRLMSVEDILGVVLRDKDFYDASGGGLTVSGGEPLFNWKFVAELLAQAKNVGLNTAVETSGYAPPTALEEVAKHADLWLYDIKGMNAARHREHTRMENAIILKNLRWLDAHGARIVLRCPMIPGINDRDEDLVPLAELADDLGAVERIDIEPYIPYGIDKAHKLGYKVLEMPQPQPEYATGIVRRLSKLTKKRVQLG